MLTCYSNPHLMPFGSNSGIVPAQRPGGQGVRTGEATAAGAGRWPWCGNVALPGNPWQCRDVTPPAVQCCTQYTVHSAVHSTAATRPLHRVLLTWRHTCGPAHLLTRVSHSTDGHTVQHRGSFTTANSGCIHNECGVTVHSGYTHSEPSLRPGSTF